VHWKLEGKAGSRLLGPLDLLNNPLTNKLLRDDILLDVFSITTLRCNLDILRLLDRLVLFSLVHSVLALLSSRGEFDVVADMGFPNADGTSAGRAELFALCCRVFAVGFTAAPHATAWVIWALDSAVILLD
jgi:hypothetical protein